MPVAFVLVNTELGRIEEVLDDLLGIDEVVEAYSVAGPYAIVAKVETDTFDKLAKVIPEKIHGLRGVPRPPPCWPSALGGSFEPTRVTQPKSWRSGEI